MAAYEYLVKVHPVVLYQIVDAYERRNADSKRVIGTLLGSTDNCVVEVTNCFCVPHREHDDKVEAELNYAMDLYDMNLKVNKLETIVGWWATDSEVTSQSSIIHDYYSRECSNPVHITLDTTLEGDGMGLNAYISIPLGVQDDKSGSMFAPIPVEIIGYDPEIAALKILKKATTVQEGIEPLSDLAQIVDASGKLIEWTDLVSKYVEDVLDEKVEPDNAIGRTLLDMVYNVPAMTSGQFEDMFNSNVKDLLMVTTLCQLTRTQLLINEKLTLLSSCNPPL